jgi:predicted nucleic acid-binding protein
LIATAEAARMLPTTAVYFDAALVAKFYVNEPGRDAVRRLAKRAGAVATSGIAVAEVAAAFHRKLREGSIDLPLFEALQGQFHHDVTRGLWTLIELTPALLQQVRALFARLDRSVFLRSLDAVHLITAKAEHFDRLYSNDTHLLAACRSVHLKGVNPIAPTIDR